MEIEKSPNYQCLNCEHPLDPQDNFCRSCGQEVNKDDTLRDFFNHFLQDYFTFDNKIARSFLPLMTKPGFLTREYLEGRRIRYIPPIRMFVFTSIVLFLLIGISGDSLSEGQSLTYNELEQLEFWNNFFESYLPKIFFVLLPVFALILRIFHRKNKKSIVREFLFSIHFHTFVFLALLAYWILSRTFDFFNLHFLNLILFFVTVFYIVWYLWQSIRTVYSQGGWISFGKLVLIGLVYIAVLALSTFLVLYVGLQG